MVHVAEKGPPAASERTTGHSTVLSSASGLGSADMGHLFTEHKRRIYRLDVLIAVSLAAAVPATTAPAAPSAAPVPDLSGILVHSALGFESPVSGPGPVTNKSRLPSGAGNFDKLVGDYESPILKPNAAEVVKRMGEISLSSKAFPDPDNQCLLNPVPYIFWNFDIQLLQQKDKVTIVYQHDEDFRFVRLNQSHPARVTPTIHGDSVGHYEGETLVIDTVGVKLRKNATMVDRFGTPFTEALHVVERYKLIDYEDAKAAQERAAKEWPRAGDASDPNYRGKGLQLEFTVEDPGVFTIPWKAMITYLKARRTEWEERICAENVEHDYTGHYYSDPDAHLPTAQKADF